MVDPSFSNRISTPLPPRESAVQPVPQNSTTSQNSTTQTNIATNLSPGALPSQSGANHYPRYTSKYRLIPRVEGQPQDRTEVRHSSIGIGNRPQLRADPIYLDIIDLTSAQQLISSYFRYFEYNVGFLDPNLYTFSYIRTSSSFLFTTLLSIAARIFRQDLYPTLQDHGELLLGRVLASCHDAVENI